MFGNVYKNWVALRQRRRKRLLAAIREQFERDGYSLENLTDSQVEEAIRFYNDPIETAIPLTGKRIYWILRRLSPNGEAFNQRQTDQAARTRPHVRACRRKESFPTKSL